MAGRPGTAGACNSIGGGDPLTSKIAILSPSSRPDADVDYLFLQVFVDRSPVSDAQGCGNILAGVGAAAIERGLVKAADDETDVRIHMVNTGEVAVVKVRTPNGRVGYTGGTAIAGVSGTHAAVPLLFRNTAGSMTGALLPTLWRDLHQGFSREFAEAIGFREASLPLRFR